MIYKHYSIPEVVRLLVTSPGEGETPRYKVPIGDIWPRELAEKEAEVLSKFGVIVDIIPANKK